MDRAEKTRLLEQLRAEIEATIPTPWLFPRRGRVMGYMGTGPAMFVGERPSTGNFAGPADRLLYSLLEEHGAADAHLTDVIKTFRTVSASYPGDIRPHQRVFDREVEIVRPHLITAFGQKVHDLQLFALAGSGIKVSQIRHYSYTRRGPDLPAAFAEQIRARGLSALALLGHGMIVAAPLALMALLFLKFAFVLLAASLVRFLPFARQLLGEADGIQRLRLTAGMHLSKWYRGICQQDARFG